MRNYKIKIQTLKIINKVSKKAIRLKISCKNLQAIQQLALVGIYKIV